MFLSIYNNRSGEEYLRRLSPTESLDLRHHVRQWLARESDYMAKPVFSEPGARIPNGCGDYQAEIRHQKAETGVVWTAEPFFVEMEEESV